MNYIEMQLIIDSLIRESKKTLSVKPKKKYVMFDKSGNIRKDYRERMKLGKC